MNEKLILPIKDMDKINTILKSNVDVLNDKSIIVDKLSFSERVIPGYNSETEYILAMCEAYKEMLNDRFSRVAENMADIKLRNKSLSFLDNGSTLPREYIKLSSMMESYPKFNLIEHKLDSKKDREEFSAFMENMSVLYDNDINQVAVKENLDIRLTNGEAKSINELAKDYYTKMAVAEKYDTKKYQATEWIDEKMVAFKENTFPKVLDRYKKDNVYLERLAENFHTLLSDYISRIDSWVK